MSLAIKTCFKLHNLCLDFGDVDDVDDVEVPDYFDDDDFIVPLTQRAVEIRDIISMYLETKFRRLPSGVVVRRK